ncbi:hypothetical protein [Mycolicibacterium sp.]|uniref:hypothetical protein n=1 Tax=Mycolicibacterium sp. TaxID=2320850 RepID=UPI0028A8722F|nr:hypothetical protein [Mycolicibacterium sp.]
MLPREHAAAELAARLKNLASDLAAAGLRTQRVPYGRGVIKARSPRGFLLDPLFPQLLLPDGRLWYFHSRLDPQGIYYDALADHIRSDHGSIPLGDMRFSFLGAVVRPYHFGYRYREDDETGAYELGAIVGKVGTSSRYVGVTDAMAAIARKL